MPAIAMRAGGAFPMVFMLSDHQSRARLRWQSEFPPPQTPYCFRLSSRSRDSRFITVVVNSALRVAMNNLGTARGYLECTTGARKFLSADSPTHSPIRHLPRVQRHSH